MHMKSTDNRQKNSEIVEVLDKAGIVPTRQRVEIAGAMLSQPQHLSADQVLALVNRKSKGVSKATVYNTLALFTEKGVVREVIVDPDRVFFDSNTDDHYHLFNEDSGTLTDIYSECLLPDALPTLPEGTELVRVDVIVRVRDALRSVR